MSDIRFARDQLRTVRDHVHSQKRDAEQIVELLEELERIPDETVSYYQGMADGLEQTTAGIDDVLKEYRDVEFDE